MSDDKIESFFLKFKECFQKIAQRSEPVNVQIKLGDECAQLHFSNPALKKLMSRSLSHLIKDKKQDQTTLTIYCFEGNLVPLSIVFPWTEIDYGIQGSINRFNTERFQTIYQHGSGAIIMFDNRTKEGIYYIENNQQIPYWEISFPFRTIFHWWTRDTSYQLLHAGGIGFSSSSTLLSGKSGSGKSSTCLSALLRQKILLAGDDYVLVNIENKILYSLYHCVKVEWANIARLNHLKGLTDEKFNNAEKAMIFIGEQMPDKLLSRSKLNFCLVPQISLANKTVITESTPSTSLKSIAPTTLFQLPSGREEAFRKCVSLSRELMTYQVSLGTNPQEIADALYTFLNNHKNHPL